MKRLITTIFGIILLTACEKSFELHPEDYSNMIRLECVADASADSVYIFPSLCIPTHIKPKGIPSLDITGLSIEVDGQEHQAQLISYNVLEDPTFHIDEFGMPAIDTEKVVVTKYRWTVPGTVPEGASLKIKASATGMEDVHGVAIVPFKPKLNISCSPFDYTEHIWGDSWTTHYLKIDIDVEDRENETGYYAVQILQKSHQYCEFTEEAKAEGNMDYDYVSTQSITPENLNISSFDDVEDNEGITIGYDGYRLAYYWSGAMRLYTAEELENTTLYLRAYPDEENRTSQYITRSGHTSQYKVKVFRVSPEIYRYAKAYNLERNNDLAAMGLAPVNFTYSNIVGGSGFFGALSSTESEWIANPFKQENR